MTNYSDRVHKIAEREAAAEMLKNWQDAINKLETFDLGPQSSQHKHELDHAYREYRAKCAEIDARFDGAAIAAANKEKDDAEAAYVNQDLALIEDSDGYAIRCSVSKIPICEDDEYVEDSETGEYFLRAVIGLPPRPETVAEGDDEDELEDAA